MSGTVFQRLTSAAFENAAPPAGPDNPGPYIVDAEGNKVDIGHVLLTLDALVHDVTGATKLEAGCAWHTLSRDFARKRADCVAWACSNGS